MRSGDLAIARVRAYAVTPADAPPVRFSGRDAPRKVTMEVVRLTLAGGREGTASFLGGWRDWEEGGGVRDVGRIAGSVLGESAAERAALTEALLAREGAGPWPAVSMIDCAMWDAYARAVGQPLWRLLGGARLRIPAYASTPAHATMAEYLAAARRLAAMGYRAVKFHMKGDPTFDLDMVRAVAEADTAGLRFMVDLEQGYGFDDAVRLGEALSCLPFDWMEAPLPDTDLDAYAALNEAVKIDILPAGNALVGLENWARGLRRGAWSRLRCDACNAGGVTTVVKATGLTRAMGVPAEIQSFGFLPAQRVNLHVMLGTGGCTWFERPEPHAPYDHGARGPLALDAQGCVRAGEGPGLGLEMDWAALEAEALAVFDSAA